MKNLSVTKHKARKYVKMPATKCASVIEPKGEDPSIVVKAK